MTKIEQYGLEFYKISSDGIIGYNCRGKDGIVDRNNNLQFLSYDPDRSIYESMVLDHVELDIEYPDFRIDERPYTFPLADIKDLLKEWLDFLKA